MPEPAPVMTATLPSNELIWLRPFVGGVSLGAFGGEVVAQFRPEVGDRVACFGEQTDLKVEVVPHVVEPTVVEEGRLEAAQAVSILSASTEIGSSPAVCMTIGGRPVISPYTGEMPCHRGSEDPA